LRRTRQVLLLVLASSAGCGQLLGIDEAFVDPTLTAGATAGGGVGGMSAPAGRGGSTGDMPGGAGNPSSEAGASGAGAGDQAGGPGASSSGQGGVGGTEAADVCEQQCELIGEFCVGDAQQYRDQAQCLRICRALPAGAVDDDRVNSASCRRRYAGKARYLAGVELAANCRYAGPGGDGRCGSNCQGLCSIVMAACRPGLSDPYFYASFEECLSDCEGLPDAPYVYGTVAEGNTLECRLFHASSAIMEDADEHCEHALGVTLCQELD
jgi:hypothetical protein